jgi:integrase/recombinase XerD
MTKPNLDQAISDYLRLRRALGYQLRVQEIQLRSFARFAAARGHQGPVTRALAEGWARDTRRPNPLTWAQRLGAVRPFARYLASTDPRTEVPPPRSLGRSYPRTPPCVLTVVEVDQLMRAAEQLTPDRGLRAQTLATLVGLLACTGLRVSEALRLRMADVDLQQGILGIRQSKYGKSRLVPLHPTAVEALARYGRQRDAIAPVTPDQRFFQLAKGVPLTYSLTRTAFRRVRHLLGWDRRPGSPRANLRSLRHFFACQRLVAWYGQGDDVAGRIHALSTYLGHSKVTDTYWYLSGIPALLAIAAQRFRSLNGNAEDEPCRP